MTARARPAYLIRVHPVSVREVPNDGTERRFLVTSRDGTRSQEIGVPTGSDAHPAATAQVGGWCIVHHVARELRRRARTTG